MRTYKSRNDVPDDKIELVNKEDLRKLAIGLKKALASSGNGVGYANDLVCSLLDDLEK